MIRQWAGYLFSFLNRFCFEQGQDRSTNSGIQLVVFYVWLRNNRESRKISGKKIQNRIGIEFCTLRVSCLVLNWRRGNRNPENMIGSVLRVALVSLEGVPRQEIDLMTSLALIFLRINSDQFIICPYILNSSSRRNFAKCSSKLTQARLRANKVKPSMKNQQSSYT